MCALYHYMTHFSWVSYEKIHSVTVTGEKDMLIISMKPGSPSFIKIKLVILQALALTREIIIEFFSGPLFRMFLLCTFLMVI